MKRANPKGYGSPSIRIWDSNGRVAIDQIDKFSFKFNEDDDDVCNITFTTKNLMIRDEAPFQTDARWKIQWGYKSSPEFPEGLYSNLRTMYVREVKTTYDTKGVTMNLTLTNGASYMKQIDPRGQGLMKNVTLGDVVSKFAGELGLEIKLDEDALIDGNGEVQIVGHKANSLTEKVKFANFLNAIQKARDSKTSRLGLNTKSGGTLNNSKPIGINDLPDTFTLYEDMFLGNSQWQTIKAMVRSESIPGLRIVGRDDTLIISLRNLNKKPIHTYVFEGSTDGELLSFSPEEKRYKKSKANYKLLTQTRLIKGATVNFVSSTDLNIWVGKEAMKKNPRIISQEQYDIYQQLIPQLKGGTGGVVKVPEDLKDLIEKDVNTILDGTEIELVIVPLNNKGQQIRNNDPNKDYSGFYEAYIEITGNKQFSRASGNTRDANLKNLNPKETDSYVIQSIAKNYGKKDDEKVTIPLGESTNRIDGTSAPSIQGMILPLRKYMPLGSNDTTAINEALNDADEAENDTNPASFRAIGQPKMESENVLIIQNVAIRDSGRYWIKEVTHTITRSGGYIIDGVLTRNTVNKSGTEIPERLAETSDPTNTRTINEFKRNPANLPDDVL